MEEVEVMVADTSGENVDNKTRLEVLMKREKLIQEEEEEKLKEVSKLSKLLMYLEISSLSLLPPFPLSLSFSLLPSPSSLLLRKLSRRCLLH